MEELFLSVDRDESGTVDAKEMQDFLAERSFDTVMKYVGFQESMFQLAQVWIDMTKMMVSHWVSIEK